MVQVKVGNKVVETRLVREITPPSARGTRFAVRGSNGNSMEWSASEMQEYLEGVQGKGVITSPAANHLIEAINRINNTNDSDDSEELALAEDDTMY